MNEDLLVLRSRLKMGEYDGNDIMQAWIAIDRIMELEAECKALRELLAKAADFIYDYCDVDINNEMGMAIRDSLFKALHAALLKAIREGK